MKAWLRRLRGGSRIARTPTILQMEAAECGAASLAMVLARHGRWVPLEALRLACGVSRDGTKATNLLKAARSYGLSAKGFKKEPGQLTELPLPSILHWNFNHFLVLEGIRRGRAHLNDPAAGRRTVGLDELGESFTGVVLAFERTDAFRAGGIRPRPWRQLAAQAGRSHAGLALVALFSLLLVVPGLVVPGLSRLFVDRVLVQHVDGWVAPLCLAVAGAALLQTAVTHLQIRYLVRLEAKLTVLLSTRVLARLLALPIPFFSQRYGGELAGRVAAADRVATLLSGQVATTAFNLVSVVVYGAAMAGYDPWLALLAAATPAVNLGLLGGLRRRMADANRKIAADTGKMLGAAAGIIAGIETIKVSGAEDESFGQLAGHHARALDSIQSLGLAGALVGAAPGLLSALGNTAILAVGALRVIDGDLTLGSLAAIQALMTGFATPLAGLVTMADRLQAARGDLARLSDLLDGDDPPAPAAPALLRHKLDGRVELVDVDFGYSPTDPPLIQGFSLVLEPGMRVALVGGSGSGKSTLGRLVTGLLLPTRGEIRIDGHKLAEIPPHVFANSVAYVDQDVFLFGGSVRENLTLWDPTVPETEIVQALKDAEIHADIAGRPGRYDCAVAEGGRNFSGGQRQRLEIARALVGNPSVLVLDEATAALDPVTELSIDQSIRRRGCTCIIIAHRLSTIRDCDRIVVLQQGRVVETGSHDELIARQGAYAQLVQAA